MKIQYNNKTYNLPDFLIVGAAKSGTTSLHYYLNGQDNVFLPEIKESYFFSFYNKKPRFKSPDPLFDVISDLDKYSDQYPYDFEGYLGDASPSYLYSYDTTIKNIKTIYGDNYKKLKIIILLRNPIDRAWSQYMHFKKNYNEPLDFRKALSEDIILNRLNNNWNYFYDYIGFGMYHEQVEAYIKEFENVNVFLFEELKNNTEYVVKKTLNFIGDLDPKININTNEIFNISGTPKSNFYSYLWRLKKIRFLKKIVRIIIPSKIKNKLNNFIIVRSLKRTSITNGDRLFLSELYKEDVEKLYNCLKKEQIKKWMP
jgi:hypothetical protein